MNKLFYVEWHEADTGNAVGAYIYAECQRRAIERAREKFAASTAGVDVFTVTEE